MINHKTKIKRLAVEVEQQAVAQIKAYAKAKKIPLQEVIRIGIDLFAEKYGIQMDKIERPPKTKNKLFAKVATL
jgi:hypothetical protein